MGIDRLSGDFRVALRRIVRHWPFSFAVVTALACALGGTAFLLNLADTILFRSIVPSASDLTVRIYTSRSDGPAFGSTSMPDLIDVKERVASLEEVAWSFKVLTEVSVGTGSTRSVLGEHVSHNYFSILGVGLRATLDARSSGVVVEQGFWTQHFGEIADDARSRILRVGGRSLPVLAIAPRSFRGLTPGLRPAFWLVVPERSDSIFSNRAGRQFDVIGMRRAGASIESLGIELRRVSEELGELYPDTNRDRPLSAVPLTAARFNPDADQYLWYLGGFLLGAAALFLLLVCLNLGGFVFSRAEAQASSTATQFALGASVTDVLRAPFLEALLLTAGSLTIALVVTLLAGERILARVFPALPVSPSFQFSPSVVVASMGLGMLATLAYGVFPHVVFMRRITGSHAFASVRVHGATRFSPRGRLAGAALASQTWVAVILSATGMLLFQSLQYRQLLDPGFRTEELTVAQVSIVGIPQDEAATVFRDLSEALAGGLVAQSDWLPLSSGGQTLTVSNPMVINAAGSSPTVVRAGVSSAFFSVMGMRFIRGTAFLGSSTPGEPLEVVITRSLATRLDIDLAQAVGSRVEFPGWTSGGSAEIVGVIEDHKARKVTESPTPVAYFRIDQLPSFDRFLIASTPLVSIGTGFREMIGGDSRIKLNQLTSIEEHVQETLAGPRSLALSFLALAGLATALVVLGAFGMTVHSTRRRAKEIAIRASLGASPSRLVWRVIVPEIRPLFSGFVIGSVLCGGIFFVFRSLFIGATLTNLSLVAATAVPPLCAAILATIPVALGTRRDPMEALREE